MALEKDEAREWTDKKLDQMERKVTKIYRKSAKGITKSWTSFMSDAETKVAKYQTKYDEAVSSGDKDLIESTSKALKNAITNQTLGNSYYRSMVDDVTTKLANVNQTALSYVNNQMPSVYTHNFNMIGKNTQSLLTTNGISFNLVDESVVKRRVLDGDISLPKKKVDIPKDKKWNTKQLNSSVLQGILQGESMNEISKRILPVVGNNQSSAIRNARTMVTGAENQGRLDRYKDLESKGAIIKKVWLATGDARTRDWHLTLDGQEKDLDEDFIDGNGNHLEMPGDTNAPAETVYNCRCTTTSHILGFRKSDGSVSLIEYDYSQDEESLHSKEIKKEQASRTTGSKTSERKVVNGTDISNTWTRRSDKFDYEIEDVLNAQGFDGLPKVVSSSEFTDAVNDSNIIAVRGYSATTKEIVDEYQNQLYNGSFYVECSGGSMHGYGMYSAGNTGTTLSDLSKQTSDSYGANFGELGKVETFTFDKSVNIITSEEIATQKQSALYEKARSLINDNGYDMNEDQELLLKAMTNTATSDEFKQALPLYGNSDYIELSNQYMSVIKEASDYQQSLMSMDDGVYAALKGYDVIEASPYGTDNDSKYYVVLNRTKCIFKKGD